MAANIHSTKKATSSWRSNFYESAKLEPIAKEQAPANPEPFSRLRGPAENSGKRVLQK
jgi:hypothetical protein